MFKQQSSRAQHFAPILLVEDRGVGMVVADGAQQVAAGFVQVRPHDRASRRNVETRAVGQAIAHDVRRKPGVEDEGREPARVDLHQPEIGGAVAVLMHQAWAASLHGLDRRQHARRQGIDMRNERHTGEIGDAHEIFPVRQLR